MYKIMGSQAANDKTVITHINILNKQACSPHGYWLAGLHWNTLVQWHALFDLNTQTTAANDNFYKRSA
jgi:hypothetical protein